MPFQIWITSSLLLFLIYGTCMPSNSQGIFWWLARKLRPGIFPDAFFTATWVFVIVVHAGEGLYGMTLARKHRMPWNVGVRLFSGLYWQLCSITDWIPQAAWVASATIFGFPVVKGIRRLGKEAGIESIMRGR